MITTIGHDNKVTPKQRNFQSTAPEIKLTSLTIMVTIYHVMIKISLMKFGQNTKKEYSTFTLILLLSAAYKNGFFCRIFSSAMLGWIFCIAYFVHGTIQEVWATFSIILTQSRQFLSTGKGNTRYVEADLFFIRRPINQNSVRGGEQDTWMCRGWRDYEPLFCPNICFRTTVQSFQEKSTPIFHQNLLNFTFFFACEPLYELFFWKAVYTYWLIDWAINFSNLL